MTLITIPLSDDLVARLRSRAEQSGLSPEEFLSLRVEQMLELPEERFRQVLAYVMKKNAELYRRLS